MGLLDSLKTLAKKTDDVVRPVNSGSKSIDKNVKKATQNWQQSHSQNTTSKPKSQKSGSTKKSYSWKSTPTSNTSNRNTIQQTIVKSDEEKSEGQKYYEELAANEPVKYAENILKQNEDYRKSDGTFYESYYEKLAASDPVAYAQNVLDNPGDYKSKEEWEAENKNQHIESRGTLDRIFSLLGYNGIVEGLYNLTDDDDSTTFSQGLAEGFRYMNVLENDVSERNTFSDVLRNLGWEDHEDGSLNIGRGIVGFIGDVLLDPLIYLNPYSSLGKIAKGTGLTLDAAKAAKVLSKSDELTKGFSSASKMSKVRTVKFDEVLDFVKKANPHMSADEAATEAEKLYRGYASKVERLTDLDEGAGFGIGLSGLPFSSKIKIGGRSLDTFQKTFFKSSTLRRIGDNTIAPYYNSMMKKLRTTRGAAAFSKYNKMLRTAEQSGGMQAFKKYYTDYLVKGLGKAAKNLADKSVADQLQDMFKDFTPDDVMQFLKDHEDGIYIEAKKVENMRLNATEEFLKKTELNETKLKKALEDVSEQRKRLEELHEAINEKAAQYQKENLEWEKQHAMDMIDTYTTKQTKAAVSQVNATEDLMETMEKSAYELRMMEEDDLADIAEVNAGIKTEPFEDKINRLQTKIDENSELANTTYRDTLSPEERYEYENRNKVIKDIKEQMSQREKELGDVNEAGERYTELRTREAELKRQREEVAEAAWKHLDKNVVDDIPKNNTPTHNRMPVQYSDLERELMEQGTSIEDMAKNFNPKALSDLVEINGFPDEARRDICNRFAEKLGLNKVNWSELVKGVELKKVVDKGKDSIYFADIKTKRKFVNVLNKRLTGADINVYAMTDDLFAPLVTDLLCEDYESFFRNLQLQYFRQTDMLENARPGFLDNYLDEAKRVYGDGSERYKQVEKSFDRYRKQSPEDVLNDNASRKFSRDKHYTRETVREYRAGKIEYSAEQVTKDSGNSRPFSRYKDSYAEQTGVYDRRYYNPFEDNEVAEYAQYNEDLMHKYRNECFNLYGVSPDSLNNDQARCFYDMIEILDNYVKQPTPIPWSGGAFFNANGSLESNVIDLELPWNDILLSWKKNTKEEGDVVSKVQEKIANQGETLKGLKKEFIELDPDTQLAIVREFDNQKVSEAIDEVKDILEKTPGFNPLTMSLDDMTPMQVRAFERYLGNEIRKRINQAAKISESDAIKTGFTGYDYSQLKMDKWNQVAKDMVKRLQFEKGMRGGIKQPIKDIESAVNSVEVDLQSIFDQCGLDVSNDKNFETFMGWVSEIKGMTPNERHLLRAEVFESRIGYNNYLVENADIYHGNKALPKKEADMIRKKLQSAIKDADNLAQDFRQAIYDKMQNPKTAKKGTIGKTGRALNAANEKVAAMINELHTQGVQLHLKPEYEKLANQKFADSDKLVKKNSMLINMFDELRSVSKEELISGRWDFLGQGPVDDIIKDLDDYTAYSGKSEELTEKLQSIDKELESVSTQLDDMAENGLASLQDRDVQKLDKLLDDAEGYKAAKEAEAKEYQRLHSNARKNTKRWMETVQDLTGQLARNEVGIDEFRERYRNLILEASSNHFLSDDNMRFIATRLKGLEDYVREIDTRMANYASEMNALNKDKAAAEEFISKLEGEIDNLQKEAGSITYEDIYKTADNKFREALQRSDEELARIYSMSEDEAALHLHYIFGTRMNEAAQREFANGILSKAQVKKHTKGWTYVPHIISEEGRMMLGIEGAADDAISSGPKKFNWRRKFDTIEEGEEVMGEGFYVHDPVELYLTRAIKSNELINSMTTNRVIKSLCTEYTGKKESDHIVASFLDVNAALRKGYSEMAKEIKMHGQEVVQTWEQYATKALAEAGIDKEMFTANYSFFDLLPEQFDVLKKYFDSKHNVKLLNMEHDVFHKVNKFTKAQSDSMKSGFLKIFDSFQTMWKKGNTYINPGFHFQNFFSNMFQSSLAVGADAWNPAKLKKAKDILRTRDPKQILKLHGEDYTFKQLADAADEYGIVDKSFFNKDIADHMENSNSFFLTRLGNEFGSMIEGTQRFQLFLSFIDQGKSFEEAAEGVEKFLFDYADLTPFEQSTMKRIIPFYTFMRKNLPLQFEMMMEKPYIYNNWQKAFREIGQMGQEGEYVEENERNPWRQGDIQLPFQINGRYYGITDQLPYTQIERVLDPQKLLGQTSPWIKTPIEALTNTFLYTGQSITGDDGEMQTGDLINYLAQQLPYAKMVENSNKSGKTEEDAATRKKLYILGQLLGFPINSVDRMYWYDDYGNWAADRFDKGLIQSIQDNRALRN